MKNKIGFSISTFYKTAFLILFVSIQCYCQEKKGEPYIPLDKNLSEEYVQSLTKRGERKVYSGKELKYIGMPCGGIGAGQVEITGQGVLNFTESIYNKMQQPNGGHGLSTGYQYLNPTIPVSKIENGFEITIKAKNKKAIHNKLNSDDFDDIQFIGEYPMAQIYYQKKQSKLPISIQGKVFSPFIPLSVRKSTNPIVVFHYSLKNTSNTNQEVTLSNNLKNIKFNSEGNIEYVNKAFKYKELSGVSMGMVTTDTTMAVLKHPQLGGFSIAVLDKNANLFLNESNIKAKDGVSEKTLEPIKGSISSTINLKPGQTKELTFMVSWYFPNYYENGRRYKIAKSLAPGWVGHVYNNWYSNSFDVVKYVGMNFNELYTETEEFRNTFHDSSLPYWLLNRVSMPLSTLAAGNIAIWKNGRLFGYEGVGFCQGTCGHVYNFVTTFAYLFPELERSVRLKQDFSSEGAYSAYSKSGRINFRGYGANHPEYKHSYASDAQSGYILKAYREHLMSSDNTFLDAVWEQVKGAIGYHIYKDGAEIGLEPNGVLEGIQTFWDPMWYGPNPYNNTLYLAALRASEEMAKIKGEYKLAKSYRNLFEKGQAYMNDKLWNGEFYFHLYPNGFKAKQASNGFIPIENAEINAQNFIENFNNGGELYYEGGACDAQQLFGQNWANQLGLGYILPKENCSKAVKSIFKYNWTPDISTVYNYQKPHARTLATKGEAAMVNGSWPHKKAQSFENNHDKFNIWSGLEYEAACDMINEGDVKNGLIVIRSIHDRYDGVKRNPWNEVEGSDHYSRAMQSWNVLRSLSGFEYNGPKGKLGYNPRITPENFKSFFSSAEGWGSIIQKRNGVSQTNNIEIKYGNLDLKELYLNTGDNTIIKEIVINLDGRSQEFKFIQVENKISISFNKRIKLEKNQKLNITIN
ncbi:GH116 family glycosyl hydrolase [Lutibacter citreus]|uniref:GH116 family glycosyl hydrolase n=1 Tax=Lutibacter citreus TaxID=2138210 RepID=UPI000DBE1A2B|nr:GH116 family glycosyl hydrolase [Lutibacter citreus]